jgi:hypothetical protein
MRQFEQPCRIAAILLLARWPAGTPRELRKRGVWHVREEFVRENA